MRASAGHRRTTQILKEKNTETSCRPQRGILFQTVLKGHLSLPLWNTPCTALCLVQAIVIDSFYDILWFCDVGRVGVGGGSLRPVMMLSTLDLKKRFNSLWKSSAGLPSCSLSTLNSSLQQRERQPWNALKGLMISGVPQQQMLEAWRWIEMRFSL